MNRPKNDGTAVETALKRYAIGAGFPQAERRALAGRKDVGDVRLCRQPETVLVECKRAMGSRGVSLTSWLLETIIETTNDPQACLGLLVVKTRGVGDKSVGRWFTACPLRFWGPLSEHLEILGSWSSTNLNPAGGLVDQVTASRAGMVDPRGWSETALGRPEIRKSGWKVSRNDEECVAGPLWWFLLGLRTAGYGSPLPAVSELHRMYERTDP